MEEILSYVADTENGFYAPEEKFWNTSDVSSGNTHREDDRSER